MKASYHSIESTFLKDIKQLNLTSNEMIWNFNRIDVVERKEVGRSMYGTT